MINLILKIDKKLYIINYLILLNDEINKILNILLNILIKLY
jgi:hypothetical protein